MQEVALEGYSPFVVLEDGSVKNTSTGKNVKPKDGMITIKSEAGEPYTASQADFKAIYDGAQPASPDSILEEDDNLLDDDSPEEAEEKNEAEKIKEERKGLVKKVAEATKNILKCKKDEIEAARMAYDAAEKALADHKLKYAIVGKTKAAKEKVVVEMTPEQQEAQKKYDELKVKYDEAKAELTAAADELKKFRPVYEGGDKGRKLTYEDAQEIRRMVSEKVPNAEIREKFGVSNSAINYSKNYLQHKLKRGDTAYTPLVNEFYPAKWAHEDGRIFEGAPYLEDGVKEDASRYKAGSKVDISKA